MGLNRIDDGRERDVGMGEPLKKVQVKICGLMDEVQAVRCAEMGADAVGLVFFSRSPRNVSDERALAICRALPPSVCPVGVFVNESYDTIMGRVKFCGLRGVQLHGSEPPDLVERLRRHGLVVVKAFFINGNPSPVQVSRYSASAILVEVAGGPLPGGNALTWDWSAVHDLARQVPTVLAGGLRADNVQEAIRAARPHAVDVSSGVEARPGLKDLDKVKLFLARVRELDEIAQWTNRVFPPLSQGVE